MTTPAATLNRNRLVCLGTRWYLVADDLTRYDWHSFRLDRLPRHG